MQKDCTFYHKNSHMITCVLSIGCYVNFMLMTRMRNPLQKAVTANCKVSSYGVFASHSLNPLTAKLFNLKLCLADAIHDFK